MADSKYFIELPWSEKKYPKQPALTNSKYFLNDPRAKKKPGLIDSESFSWKCFERPSSEKKLPKLPALVNSKLFYKIYHNNPKKSDTQNNCLIILKFEQCGLPYSNASQNMQTKWQTV